MKTTGLFLTAIFLISLAVMAFQLTPQQLPPPYHTPSANNRPQVIPRPEGSTISVPAGFQVSVFAEGFERPRFMLLGPGKEILLSDSVEAGSVYVLPDRNGDGKPDEKRKIIEGLDRPYGLALWKEYLYVGEPGSVKRYKYDSGARKG